MVAELLRLDRVSKYFGAKRAVHEATLALGAGERIVVTGGNGSGKTTLLAIASGVLSADEGRVERSVPIGYAPEKPDIPDHLLVVEWLDVVASLKRARVGNADDLDLRPLFGKRVSALSLGQRQRVSLCAAFLGEPPLLVLDEPTNGLDRATRGAVIERLRGATALVATHDADLVTSLSARLVRMKDGRLVEGEADSSTSP